MTTSLEQGIQAARDGNNPEAIRLLAAAIQQDPQNISAWLWLSNVVDDPAKKKYCLEKILAIAPFNQSAQDGLAAMEADSQPDSVVAAPQAAPVPADPLSDTQPRRVPSAQPGGEVILFQDENLPVSDRRIITVKEVYSLNGITSAGVRKIHPVMRYLLTVIIPLVIFLVVWVWMSFFGYSLSFLYRIGIGARYGVTATLLIGGTLTGLILGIIQAVIARPKYELLLKAWANEIGIFTSKDRVSIEKIVATINQAIRQYGALNNGQSGQVPMQFALPGNSAWSGGQMAGLVIGSMLMPIFGIIYGIIGLTQERKRAQAAIILFIACVFMIGYGMFIYSLLGG